MWRAFEIKTETWVTVGSVPPGCHHLLSLWQTLKDGVDMLLSCFPHLCFPAFMIPITTWLSSALFFLLCPQNEQFVWIIGSRSRPTYRDIPPLVFVSVTQTRQRHTDHYLMSKVISLKEKKKVIPSLVPPWHVTQHSANSSQAQIVWLAFTAVFARSAGRTSLLFA